MWYHYILTFLFIKNVNVQFKVEFWIELSVCTATYDFYTIHSEQTDRLTDCCTVVGAMALGATPARKTERPIMYTSLSCVDKIIIINGKLFYMLYKKKQYIINIRKSVMKYNLPSIIIIVSTQINNV